MRDLERIAVRAQRIKKPATVTVAGFFCLRFDIAANQADSDRRALKAEHQKGDFNYTRR